MASVMLAEKWEDQDPTGWWMSEKLDGMRAWWDGHGFSSRNGIHWTAPAWFKQGLPAVPLDGELWCGRGQFKQTVSIVKNSKRQDDWKFLTYLVFDAPKFKGDFEERYAFLRTIVGPERTQYARLVGQVECKGREHLSRTLAEVEDLGGEGLMLRKPHSQYEYCRTTSLLKVKSFVDEEAKVTGHKKGQGRNAFRMGHLVCVTPDGREFSVGGGFTDKERDKPPKIGSIITYKYFELSESGKPRFPIFVSVREDINWDEYCKNYKPFKKADAKDLKIKHSILFSNVDDLRAVMEEKKVPPAVPAPDAGAAASEAPAAPSVQQKKPCKYGAKCYRQNPEHLEAFSHPPVTPLPYVSLDLDNATPPALPDDVPKSPMALMEASFGDDGQFHDEEEEKPKQQEEKKRPLDEPSSDQQPELKRPKSATPSAPATLDGRPLCRYGAACYQRNPQHRAKFAHRDEEPAKTGPARVTVVLEDGTRHVLPQGLTTIGRGFGGMNSQQLSRRHLDFNIGDEVSVILRGINASVILRAGVEERCSLPVGEPCAVGDGDLIWLLPDLTIPVKVEIAH